MMKKTLLAILVAATVVGCTKNNSSQTNPPDTHNEEPVEYYEQCLFRPGDYGSANWRIPAILCLDDGSLLIACDKRKYNESDLPEDIDIVVRRSTDRGRTWSEPLTIAEGQGRKKGFGDAALVQCANGDVICAFVGSNGLLQSSESDPIRSYICRSTDGGKTWTAPQDITTQLWGSHATNAACRYYRGSFFASGNGLRLTRGDHAGRIMFAAAMIRKPASNNTLDNFVVYSDDNGHTWQVSELAYTGGDEAKLIELNDGRLLISVRQKGPRGYNHSNDDGETWGTQGVWSCMASNACNGDMLRVSDTILLHSIPNSMERENVSIFVSRDEGDSWQDPVLLFDGPSVYSSLTLLKDGSVGVFLEENPSGACELWYQNWPVDSLVNRH